jgi:hypothetical protein
MGKAVVIIRDERDRIQAAHWASKAPEQTRITFARSKRTLPQNDRMWAMLTEVSAQVDWYGERLTPDDWKTVFTAALRKERVVPGINGGFVVLGQRTSDMSKDELSDLMELISAFASARGVKFGFDA